MKPTMYLDELISEIRWDDREEFDRFIYVLDAFYQTGAITDHEFLVGVSYLTEELKRFGTTEEGVKELFTTVPETPFP